VYIVAERFNTLIINAVRLNMLAALVLVRCLGCLNANHSCQRQISAFLMEEHE
jgi:hypothetical protein